MGQSVLVRSTDWGVGYGLDRAERSKVRFQPVFPGTGIRFVRYDLPGNPEVGCRPENARRQPRWAALEESGVWVHHTKHVLAAIAGERLDDLLVEVTTDRVPILSAGRCEGFSRALQDAGQRETDIASVVWSLRTATYFEAPLEVPLGAKPIAENGSRRYVFAIPADNCAANFLFHAPAFAPDRIGWAEYRAITGFADTLGRARSSYLESEEATLTGPFAGLREAFVRLRPSSPQAVYNEVARHRLVDFVGDLMVLGRRLLSRFAVFRSGHHFHLEFVDHLVMGGLLELLSEPSKGGGRGHNR